MGGGNSQTMSQTFELDVLNKTLTRTITNYQQSISSTMENTQTLDFIIRGDMGPNCEINLSQKIDATSTSSAEMSPETSAAAKAAAKAHLTAKAKAAAEKKTQMGNLQFGDKQDVSQDVKESITNVVESVFETNSMNDIVAKMVNVQPGKIELQGDCNGKITVNQNVIAVLAAEALTDALTSAITDNQTLSDLAADGDASAKTESGGVAEVIAAIGEALAGPMKWIVLASVMCCCILVIGGVIMSMSPAGQKQVGKMGGMGRMGGGMGRMGGGMGRMPQSYGSGGYYR